MAEQAVRIRPAILQFPANTRLLVIGDSFARRCENVIRTRYPEVELKVIAVGDKTAEIVAKYNREFISAQQFRPTHIILHEGHNEMAFHPDKNPLPQISRDVVATSITFAVVLRTQHPNAIIMISATFPRTYTSHSVLSRSGVVDFNTRMKRHGQRVRTMAERNNLVCIINNFSWGKISKCLEKPSYYEWDGYHLNGVGMHAQAKEWMHHLAIPTLPPP